MADFTSLCADVYSLTNRPDLINETQIAVKSATLKAHGTDTYFKDLVETGISFTTSDYIQTIDYRALIPAYRSLKYLRKYDSVGLTAGIELDIITPDQIFDDYKLERTDVCYVAGSAIQLKMSTQEQYMILGVYVYPTVDSATTFNSWIAIERPYMIVYEAAATVLGLLEKTAARDYYRTLAREEAGILIEQNILANAY